MGLIKDLTIIFLGKRMYFGEAFHEITYVEGNEKVLEITVSIFESQEKKTLIDSQKHSFVPNDEKGFVSQGYQYLRTLPDYENAMDVLEA